jgi:hypothetical protein
MFDNFPSERSKDAILAKLRKLEERLDKMESVIRYEIKPELSVTLYTGKTGLIDSPYSTPQYGEITHNLRLVDAVQALAKDQGLEFTYIPGTPAHVALKEKQAQVTQS